MQENTNDIKIIKTDEGNKNGQDRCPKCGATEIEINEKTGKLRCNYCRYEFKGEKIIGLEEDITQLSGEIIGSGASNIIADTNEVITLKCNSCGAEVVIDTSSSRQSRCHWCRHTLSINQQIPNGSIPDVVLPFAITKEEARRQIEAFVGKRKFFAHPKFKAEFTTENIMGVYFPYMIIDVNSHATLSGQGEHLVKTYTRGTGENTRTYYDADIYNVERDFDLTIHGLTVESNSARLNQMSVTETNNIINAIMPFDIENSVKYNANYLKGYTSERRDTNVEDLTKLVNMQAKNIAKFKANDTIKQYDRGVLWSQENFTVKGHQWKAAYLPVWLYSYRQTKNDRSMLHYVAVNARTKETMGSIPLHASKLLGISALVEILGIIMAIYIDYDYSFLFLLSGILYFILMFLKYRNLNARHKYETETKSEILNLKKADNYITRKTGLTNSKMQGANNTSITGQDEALKVFDTITENIPFAQILKDNIDKNGGK